MLQNVNFSASVWLLIHFPLFLIKSATIGCPKSCVAKNSDQLSVLNRLTDIFAVDEFDYCVIVRYQSLTRKPEVFRAPLGPGTMYPLNPPLAGPGSTSILRTLNAIKVTITDFILELW